jgi:hypothetical protein
VAGDYVKTDRQTGRETLSLSPLQATIKVPSVCTIAGRPRPLLLVIHGANKPDWCPVIWAMRPHGTWNPSHDPVLEERTSSDIRTTYKSFGAVNASFLRSMVPLLQLRIGESLPDSVGVSYSVQLQYRANKDADTYLALRLGGMRGAVKY